VGTLIPAEGSAERYEALSSLTLVSTEIHKMGVYPLAAPHFSDQMTDVTKPLLTKQLTLANDVLSTRDHLAGDFGVADAYLFWALTLLPKLGYEIPRDLTALASYSQRQKSRTAFQQALGTEAELAQAA